MDLIDPRSSFPVPVKRYVNQKKYRVLNCLSRLCEASVYGLSCFLAVLSRFMQRAGLRGTLVYRLEVESVRGMLWV